MLLLLLCTVSNINLESKGKINRKRLHSRKTVGLVRVLRSIRWDGAGFYLSGGEEVYVKKMKRWVTT